MDMYKREQFINGDGEVYGEREQRIFSRWHSERGYKLYHNRKSINGISDISFPVEMTPKEIGYSAMLSRYLVGESNLLGYRGAKNVWKAMSPEMMFKKLGVKKSAGYTFMKKMNRLGMIAKVTVELEGTKQVHYYMNPLYFHNGKHVPLNLYLIFQDQIDRYIPKWAQERYAEMQRDDADD